MVMARYMLSFFIVAAYVVIAAIVTVLSGTASDVLASPLIGLLLGAAFSLLTHAGVSVRLSPLRIAKDFNARYGQGGAEVLVRMDGPADLRTRTRGEAQVYDDTVLIEVDGLPCPIRLDRIKVLENGRWRCP